MELSEANKLALPYLKNNKVVIVCQDSHIYLGEKGASEILKNNPDSFLIKDEIGIEKIKLKKNK
jgi:threonine aldolase